MGMDGENEREPRPHTGRRRNEQARLAVLGAARDLLLTRPYGEVTMAAIVERAGVGKQTLYRWWGSRADIVLDVLTEESRRIEAAQPVDGPLAARIEAFLADTVDAIVGDGDGRLGAGPALRALMAEAQVDPEVRVRLRDGFSAERRAGLFRILADGVSVGELPTGTDADLLVDMAFGAIWYRLLLGHGALTRSLARELAAVLAPS
jgi:AcrR family transcriptional regulator